MTTFAQAPTEPQPQPATVNAVDQNNQLMDQIAELRAQVAKLQEAVQLTGPGKKPAAKRGMKMGHGKGKNMAMEDDKGDMGGMAPKAAMPAAAGAMKNDQGEMGSMSGGGAVKPGGGMAGMSGPSTAMPGLPAPRVSTTSVRRGFSQPFTVHHFNPGSKNDLGPIANESNVRPRVDARVD